MLRRRNSFTFTVTSYVGVPEKPYGFLGVVLTSCICPSVRLSAGSDSHVEYEASSPSEA
jgi:hypothetical protein